MTETGRLIELIAYQSSISGKVESVGTERADSTGGCDKNPKRQEAQGEGGPCMLGVASGV